MAIKKSQIYASLWTACDELRGGIEPASYKDYVLVFLFIKYISDKYTGKKFAPILVPEGSSFKDLVKLKGKVDIGYKINNNILRPISEANNLHTFPDFNDPQKLGSGKEMVERLTKLISVFEDKNLDFSKNQTEGDDILGDAYEYLMRNFASESGKKKGAFYTPAEVSRIMSAVLEISKDKTSSNTTVYDPTCGSGSLLLKVSVAAKSNVTVYGQELDISTANLAQMNMILHDNPTAEVSQGNVISNPKFLEKEKLKQFNYVVANPPFSDKRWSNGIDPENDIYQRFDLGIPPSGKGDFAYMLHILKSLKKNGKAAVILPFGVLFRGNNEEVIRKNILKEGYIKCIINLPPNLFYGTSIPACIVLINNNNNLKDNNIFLIDASQGFAKDGPKNRLREMDVKKIIDVFDNSEEIENYSKFVNNEEIVNNNYNLSLAKYISQKDTTEIQDIEAHLKGGIPENDISLLKDYWQELPNLHKELFKSKKKGYLESNLKSENISEKILNNSDTVKFKKKISIIFEEWKNEIKLKLDNLDKKINPKNEVKSIAGSLLKIFSNEKLIDPYKIYQILMSYSHDVFLDDMYFISENGWTIEIQNIFKLDKKGNKKEKGWKCELLPKEILIKEYFKENQIEIDSLNEKIEIKEESLKEFVEEETQEDGCFSDFETINKSFVNQRIKELKGEPNTKNELEKLIIWKEKRKKINEIKKEIKEKHQVLDDLILNKYAKINQKEIKQIVINQKWLNYLENKIIEHVEIVLNNLVIDLIKIIERYKYPLSEIESKTNAQSQKVKNNLKDLGFKWD